MSQMKTSPTEEDIAAETLKLWLEEEDSLAEQINTLINGAVQDFPDEDDKDEAAKYAAEIARAVITDKTREGHLRIVKAYIAFHMRKNTKWDAKQVNSATPFDITSFIIQKCGEKEKGCEGKKYSTAVSTRAALTYWYRTIRPNESVSEWRIDSSTGQCYGLPTRSRHVSEFMTGLEKTKAKAGEVSTSARALSLSDMHNLYDHCFRPNATPAEMRWGITAYLFAWLLLLRFEEVVRLQFESINMIPGTREYFEVQLSTRKSAQTGVGHAWTLHANDTDPKICPVRALIRLAVVYGETVSLTGALFLKVNKNGAILQDPITTSVISRNLTIDLQNLGYKSWTMYGTHSFRRGGCQHRIKNKGWTVDMVAAWGGWSQVEAITMFRYFYSPKDNHEFMADYDRNVPKRQRLE
ncbi:hypothetical protein R3P38DRAFT_3321031 [Favolaschia claudopus]|uniref:Tyr recombinase domain-containing protein n=1 Tax=Favolaschia claudopus TaxID=2862362 RepID=A0AAW0AST4_9AGAR